MKKSVNFEFDVYDSITDLAQMDSELLNQAIDATNLSYSPYSGFKVGAAAITNKNNIILGSNQENSSYSVTICAERVLLSTLSINYPNEYINTIAISANNPEGSNQLVTPCGVCRQALFEHEMVNKQSLRIILGSHNSQIYIIKKANDLLPLAFNLDLTST